MMSRSKSKKNRASLLNVIDIVIVLVVAVILAYIVYVNVLGHSLADIGAKKVTIEYTVVIDNFDENNQRLPRVRENVMSADGKTFIGTVSKITVNYPDDRGITSLEVTVKAQAYVKKGAYRIDKMKIAANDTVSLRFPTYSPSSDVRCIDIKVI